MAIPDLIPDANELLALEPEELAGVLLKYLVQCEKRDAGKLNRYNFGLYETYQAYPRQYHDQVARALMEAWMWLEREGFLAPKPGQQQDWFFITRRGHRFAEAEDQTEYRRSLLLPKRLLHPLIAQKVWALFLRGDFDTAVFQGFKEVEVAVRDACGFSPEHIGVPMMRKAFHPDTGPLTDPSLQKAERESMMHLFAGGIGLYKNPHSHRHVQLDVEETISLLMLASHLLFIVDRRSGRGNK